MGYDHGGVDHRNGDLCGKIYGYYSIMKARDFNKAFIYFGKTEGKSLISHILYLLIFYIIIAGFYYIIVKST